MKSIVSLVLLVFLLVGCKSQQPSILSTSTNPFRSTEHIDPLTNVDGFSMNKDYGLKGEYPIMVGDKSPSNQRRYIAALAGPEGETLSFHRR